MTTNHVLTASRLREVLNYDPRTGMFTWLIDKGSRVKVGDVAGCKNKKGYVKVVIDQKQYTSHRLAFLWMTGEFPPHQVDHKNGVHDDNRWLNLREATGLENQQNHKINRNNTSGYLGVTRDTGNDCWRAQIAVNGINKYLGLFDTPQAAHAEYLAAKAKLHEFQPVPRVVHD